MKKMLKKSEVLREGYINGLQKAQSIISKMISESNMEYSMGVSTPLSTYDGLPCYDIASDVVDTLINVLETNIDMESGQDSLEAEMKEFFESCVNEVIRLSRNVIQREQAEECVMEALQDSEVQPLAEDVINAVTK